LKGVKKVISIERNYESDYEREVPREVPRVIGREVRQREETKLNKNNSQNGTFQPIKRFYDLSCIIGAGSGVLQKC
jgi:hypothetical protein